MMTVAPRKFEFETRTMLAAVQFTDAVTGLPVTCPVKVQGDGLRIWEKPNGRVLVMAVDDDKDPTAAKTNHVINCRPSDPAYMPRKASIAIPRTSDGTSESIFNSIPITLYPSTSYRCMGNLGGLLVTVKEPPGNVVQGVVVTLKQTDTPSITTRTITNAAGEALLMVKGAAVVQYSAGTHTEDISATLEILVDADPVKRVANTEEAIAKARAENILTDPEVLLNTPGLALKTLAVSFRAGRIQPLATTT
jgi:hypothetical protein